MSTGLDCSFVETPSGRHYYSIEIGGCPDDEDDGCPDPEYATYGPFASHEAAKAHLDSHHPNPGGWTLHKLDEEPSGALARSLERAIAPGSSRPF